MDDIWRGGVGWVSLFVNTFGQNMGTILGYVTVGGCEKMVTHENPQPSVGEGEKVGGR
jgi:hypothetical protein